MIWLFSMLFGSFKNCDKHSNFCNHVCAAFTFPPIISSAASTAVLIAESCKHASNAIFVTYENVGIIGISEINSMESREITKIVIFSFFLCVDKNTYLELHFHLNRSPNQNPQRWHCNWTKFRFGAEENSNNFLKYKIFDFVIH